MKLFRKCPLSNKTTLTVKSWNSWLTQAFVHTDALSSEEFPSTAFAEIGSPDIGVTFVKPNLTPTETQDLAREFRGSSRDQLLNIDIVMPGDTNTRPGDVLSIQGIGVTFDSNYIVGSVRRHFSSSGGFIQYIHGFEVSPVSLQPLTASGL